MPIIVDTRLETMVVFAVLEAFKSSFLLRNIASMRTIGMIDDPSAA